MKSPMVGMEGVGLKVFLACVKPSESVLALDGLEVAVVALGARPSAASLTEHRRCKAAESPSSRRRRGLPARAF